MLKVIRAKLHGLRVTEADLNYHGSITLDPEHCALARIHPLEFVDIWNKNSGARLSTYVIFGEPGSRCCVLNGAAARSCQRDDELIIAAADYTTPDKLYGLKPRILTFMPDNQIDQILEYEVFKSPAREFDFHIIDARDQKEEICHTYSNVDVSAVRDDLKARGWSEEDAEAFVARHLAL